MAKYRVTHADDGVTAARVPAQSRLGDPQAAAWEFLRRNPAYQADVAKIEAGEADGLPDHWGLTRAVDPDLETPPAGAWRLAPMTTASPRHGERALEYSRRASARCSDRASPDVPRGSRTGA
ncbi:transcriptional regulator domain-containing protein [Caulobacter radicis]|uniref:transcriptional regulator domain-containing protein n=1 Tax=Caulobacter radicis TaxID=2172650 RepID=UPI003CC55F30